MNQKVREQWVIPTIVALATGIPLGSAFMFFGIWLTGTPIHVSFSFGWIIAGLSAPLPVWLTLCVVTVAAIALGLFIRQRARTQEERDKNAAIRFERDYAQNKLADHLADGPKLHIAWDDAQTIWSLGGIAGEQAMQIGGWAHISSSDTKEALILTSAYIEGTEPRAMLPIRVNPRIVSHTQLMCFLTPVIARPGEPFRTRIIVVDHQNRRHILEEHTFRWVGSQQQIDDFNAAGAQEPSRVHPMFAGENLDG